MRPSLVILAAGIGSRYGGIKQLDEFGPSGERIIDYTVYDAIEVGYEKIIFVIRKEIESDFNEGIKSRWEDKCDIRIVHQELDHLPEAYQVPKDRKKPWGTAHAVWMAESEINEPFAIVNADDYYGRDSLRAALKHLETLNPAEHGACLIGYEIGNTLTDSGSVSRGVCKADESGFLTEIIERTKIARNGDGNIYFEENGDRSHLKEDTLVSMNLMGFTPKVFEEIEAGFREVYEKSDENPRVEYFIPTVLNKLIHKGVQAPVIPTKDQWFGVTYVEDKPDVKKQFERLHASGTYPENLWK